jgi:chromosome segregation protein
VCFPEEIGEHLRESEIELKTVEFEQGSLKTRSLKLNELDLKIKQSIEELTYKSDEQGRQIVELTDKKDMLSASMDEQKQILENAEAAHTETFKNTNRLKIELVSLQGRQLQIESEMTRLAELIQEIENTQTVKAKESEDSKSEIERITQATSDNERELKQLFQQIEEQKTNLTSQTEEHARWQEGLKLKEINLKASRHSKERVQDELHQLRMQQVELSSRQKSIQDRVFEEYQVNLEEAESEAKLSAEEGESLEREVGELKEKLRSIGAVNLLALEEYQSAKHRLDFLQTQVKDLTEAKETLASTIAKINDTARTLFTETFEKIRVNFQKVFEELFEGGETDLRLEEADDPLESPVRISARPYGKKLLSISQLSGGEKALTAIALLFAIYLVKPSPFCILDEVDAPLDDANITRFVKLIQHFSSNTQFIIITHNKLTMEAADVLYGVTMEQPGVSKIVSVKFDKHELVTEHNPDADQAKPSEETVSE